MATNVTTEQLQKALEQLAAQMGVSVHDYVQSQGFAKEADVIARFQEVNARIDAITKIDPNDNVETIAEKIQALKEILDQDNGAIQTILDKLAKNETAIADLNKAIADKFAAAQSQIDTINEHLKTLDTNTANIQKVLDETKAKVASIESAFSDRIQALEKSVATLTGDETVEGSVANLVKTEADRAKAAETALGKQIETAKADAIAQAKAYTDQAIDEKIAQADLATNDEFVSLKNEVESIESVLEDTTDENGNLEKGLVSRVGDLETAVSNVKTQAEQEIAEALEKAQAYADSVAIQVNELNITNIVNVFASALKTGQTSASDDSSTSNDSSSDGEVL